MTTIERPQEQTAVAGKALFLTRKRSRFLSKPEAGKGVKPHYGHNKLGNITDFDAYVVLRFTEAADMETRKTLFSYLSTTDDWGRNFHNQRPQQIPRMELTEQGFIRIELPAAPTLAISEIVAEIDTEPKLAHTPVTTPASQLRTASPLILPARMKSHSLPARTPQPNIENH